MSVYDNWERHHIDHPSILRELFEQDKPLTGGADTETTGLHIKKDVPFLIAFGWFKRGTDEGRVFTFEPTKPMMDTFFYLAKKLKQFVWWNTKYDLHMKTNIGYRYDEPNLVEGMAIARLTSEAVPARHGGISLKLKDVAKRYVDAKAGDAEDHLNALKKEIKKKKTALLAASLKQFPLVINGEQQYTATGRVQYWGVGAINRFIKDITNTVDDLPEGVRELWNDFIEEYGGVDVTYDEIYEQYPEEMIHYAQDDIINMLVFVKKAYKVLLSRKQQSVLERENKCILPLYRMERVGLVTDREYLLDRKDNMRKYIRKLRMEMYAIAGKIISISGSSKDIANTLRELWSIRTDNTQKSTLEDLQKEHADDEKLVNFIQIIIDLRSLEKWYSTYIIRPLENSEEDGRFYTQIQQTSAVSGRVGSDSQQFPKKAILDRNGNELFHPRKMFVSAEGHSWYLLDFSQIELRNQANYTLLVSGGDLRMCRSYMPFKCVHYLTGETFKFMNVKDRGRWNELREGHPEPSEYEEGINDVLNEGWSVWKVPETGEFWKPTDVHSETTGRAFPHLEKGTDEFKEWRSKGKTFNFMRNYGGGKDAAMKSIKISEEAADALVRGYSEAFPQVLVYQNKVVQSLRSNGYVTNMYGRRYYLNDTNKAYKLANYCIQGTCADMLKECIIEIDELLLNYKSSFVMTVHDELSFYIAHGEEFLVPKIKHIMENHPWHYIPIIADVELATDTWHSAKTINLEVEAA